MRIVLLTLILFFSLSSVYSQNAGKKSKKRLKAELKAEQIRQIRDILNSKNFVFKAKTVNPVNMKQMTLRSDFGVEVRGDSIFSYLPYFGNEYVRDFSSYKNSPLGFMLPITKYSRSGTNNGYKIQMKVKNENEFINLIFHISKTGYTSLSATFLIRQSISFEGEILIPLSNDEPEEQTQ
jgi:hypothetical protein